MYAAIDDTDSRDGGCTTFTAFACIKELQNKGYYLTDSPCLVRLNPNIPWKTRGNGAVSFMLGKGGEKSETAGEFYDTKLSIHNGCEEITEKNDMENIMDIISEVIEKEMMHDENCNPGVIISKKKFPEYIYSDAVRNVVKKDDVLNNIGTFLNNEEAFLKQWGNGRGITGCAAAIAWPQHKITYELLAYRNPEIPRDVDINDIIKVDKLISTTFNNYDYTNRHCCAVPATPCPILYGIRNTVKEGFDEARKIIRAKGIGWLIFKTNQATGDHLLNKKICEIEEFMSVNVTGKVSSIPYTKKGGHVFFDLSDDTGEIKCAAFEPTKEFRDVVLQLFTGDVITASGGIKEGTINLEKIEIHNLTDIKLKTSNPVCYDCGKKMKSKGKSANYKCRICGNQAAKDSFDFTLAKRNISIGRYYVPVCGRRHLGDIGLFY